MYLIPQFYLTKSRKENPQKLTQLSSRSHPRHLVGKRTAQKDITIDTTSDSQVSSNFPNRWSPASLTFNNYFYAPAYSKNSGRALSVTPVRPVRLSVRPSVRTYVPLSCPGHNSQTLWNIFMKLHRCIHHNKRMCHEQGRQLLHFLVFELFPLDLIPYSKPCPGHYS